MTKRFWLCAVLLLAAVAVSAQVRILSSVNKQTLYQGEMLVLNLKVSSPDVIHPDFPADPDVEGLRFVNRSSSQETRSSLTNGRLERSFSITYSFYFYPTRAGKINIPAQNLRVGKSIYQSMPITVDVLAGSQPQKPPQDPFDFDYYSPGPTPQAGESMILCLPENQTVYRSEPAIVSYYLYTTEDVRSFNLAEELDFDGYGKALYEQPSNLVFERITYQGKSYRRSLLKRLVLYPHKTGTLRAPEMAGSVRTMSYTYINRSLRSRTASIQVRELPPGAPSGFSGAVGNFSISEKLSAQSIKLGEAVVLSIQINGQGNFSQFSAPVLVGDSRMQVSAPQIKDQLHAKTKGLRILQYTLVPRVKGEIRLPQLKFSWLDSATGRYMSYTSSATVLSVKPGSGVASTPNLDKYLDKYTMRPALEMHDYAQYRMWHLAWWYWLIAGMVLLSLPAAIIRKRQHARLANNPGLRRQRDATSLLNQQYTHLKNLSPDAMDQFYPLAENALIGYLSHKYELPAHLGLEELFAKLGGKDLSDVLLDEMKSFLADIQAARYAPPQAKTASVQAELRRFASIVNALLEQGKNK